MSKTHIPGNQAALCGSAGFAVLISADNLCRRCVLGVQKMADALAVIVDTESVGAVRCEWCGSEGEGRHRRTCPREVAARGLGYKTLAEALAARRAERNVQP